MTVRAILPAACRSRVVSAMMRPMAQAILITLEKDLPEATAAYAKSGTGKALAREVQRIDFAARKCKVAQPSTMVSESQAVLIAQLKEDGFDPAKMRIPPEHWYTSAEGLAVVRALIEHIGANLNDFKQPNPILRDLKAAEALLAAADAVGVRFHFTKGEL
jgi:hypothetical protein